MPLLRYAWSLVRSIFASCAGGLFHSLVEYPEVFDALANEFLDTDVNMWLPLFLWWDRQHRLRRAVPNHYVPDSSLDRFKFVTAELLGIERRKRAYYARLVEDENIAEADAYHILTEWSMLKEQILDEEYKKMQDLELDRFCQICFERQNDTIASPCGHQLCRECYAALACEAGDRAEDETCRLTIKRCPFCREVVDSVVYTRSENCSLTRRDGTSRYDEYDCGDVL